jgi:hypothetical protein
MVLLAFLAAVTAIPPGGGGSKPTGLPEPWKETPEPNASISAEETPTKVFNDRSPLRETEQIQTKVVSGNSLGRPMEDTLTKVFNDRSPLREMEDVGIAAADGSSQAKASIDRTGLWIGVGVVLGAATLAGIVAGRWFLCKRKVSEEGEQTTHSAFLVP